MEASESSDPSGPPRRAAPLWLIAAALFSLYLIWGSTYLGIAWAVRGFPPLFVAATRALVAGAIIYVFARARGAERPTREQWRAAAIVGTLLLLGGNGLVSIASQWVPSSFCALIVGLLPVWMVVLDRGSEARRSGVTWLGVGLGLSGVALLVGPKVVEAARRGSGDHGTVMQAVGMGLLLCSSLCWANGSLYSRRALRPRSALVGTGMQLLCGGVVLLVVSAAIGEPRRMTMAAMFGTPGPGLAVLYLTFFGTLLGYTSYIWLLEVTEPAIVSSYAFVNPVVAVVLGALLNGEAVSVRVGVAATVITIGVVAIVRGGAKRVAPPMRFEQRECVACERGAA